ncbi:hypothetical protein NX029_26285 [Cytobacillus firmus]|nr:hypothetical protein [Cytobacillus firmus]
MSLGKQIKRTPRNKKTVESPVGFDEAGTLEKEEGYEQLEHEAVKDIPEVPITKSQEDRLEALKRKHEAEMKKKKAKKKQISTYLEPRVLEVYENYGTEKGDKQRLINDLLKAYFGIED